MKIVAERDALSRALTAVSRLIPAKPNVPVLGNILLSVEGHTLTVRATNLEIETIATVPCDVDSSDIPEITGLGRLLASTVGGMPKGAQVSLEWTDDRAITVRAGTRSRYRILALPADQFPRFMPMEDAVSLSISARAFKDAVSSTEFAIADDASRPYLNGVALHVANPEGHPVFGAIAAERLVFVATDAHQFSWVGMAAPDGVKDLPSIIIPETAIKEMARIAGDADDDAEVALAVTGKRMLFTSGSISVGTRLIEATYPPYMQSIPRDGYRDLIVDTAEFSSALARLIGIGDATRAEMNISSGQIVLSLKSTDNGDAEERIDAQWDHEDTFKRVNARAFLKVLDHIKSELCCVRLNQPALPILFNDYIGQQMVADRTFLSMPMDNT